MTSAPSDVLPFLAHPLDLGSDFTPQPLIEAVRTKRGCLVCILDGDITERLVESKSVPPWLNWACFHTPTFALEVNGKPCGIVPRTIRGSYSVLVAEQLLASGARVVIGLTSAGRVSENWQIPSSSLRLPLFGTGARRFLYLRHFSHFSPRRGRRKQSRFAAHSMYRTSDARVGYAKITSRRSAAPTFLAMANANRLITSSACGPSR